MELLKGLEVSVINLSYALQRNDVFRIDSNYFLKEFIEEESLIRCLPNRTLKDLDASLLSFGAYSLNNYVSYLESGIPFIRGINMKKGRVDFHDMIYISNETNELLWKSEVKPETVLLSMSGTIGDVAIASKDWKYPINSNQDIAKINTNGKINPYYLYTFLSTKYGQNYLKREARGSVQQHVFLSQMELFEIPIFNDDFYIFIQKIIEETNYLFANSKVNYTQAEELLLKEIGLKDFEPSKEAVNVKTFSESFATSGRLDAEYYQKKYEQVVEKITNQNYDKLNNIVTIKKSIEPGSKYYDAEGLPFMRVADYDKYGLTEPQKYLSEKFVKENEEIIKSLKPQKGTILFSKDGSVGTAYHLREDFNGITSGAILHLKVKDNDKIITEYLTLVLNSQIVKMQSERDAGGSIILHWRVSEIENVIVPIIDFTKQKEISKLIEKSFALKKESEHLLEVAKRAVEIAIKENEEVALEYIENRV